MVVDLAESRKKIDEIDKEIVRLFHREEKLLQIRLVRDFLLKKAR